ncbi:MAG: putative metalloprotease CJM1_0395 family protein, partial [Sulfurimonas sp.]
ASFSYQKGPDGKMYAIGGEVPISFKEGSTPEETIANARQVVAAAMAPANPSPQDYAVASSARMMEMQAQQELVKKLQEEQNAQAGHKTYADAQNNL